MDGILLIDKPAGWTSFDVVAKVRGMLRQATGLKRPKVGHTGTLDPLATGLMVVVVGTYCKRASEFSKLDKTYQVTARLGYTSATGDEEGEKRPVSTHQPSDQEVHTALHKFTGPIQQIPPAYSAIKVDGKRAYQLAREGKTVELTPRPVTIHAITEVTYAYPHLSFTTHVSSGTYIRTLVEDIGAALGTGAYTTALRRTTVGAFSIEQARPVSELSPDTIAAHIMTMEVAERRL
jgi:tRNA pseudouridine55 synthase